MNELEQSGLKQMEKEHLREIRRGLAECMVLLKSDGSFPLDQAGQIALYGSGARQTVKGGTGSGEVNTPLFFTIEKGLEERGFTITTKAWLDSYDAVKANAHKQFLKEIRKAAKKAHQNPLLAGMGKVMAEPDYQLPLDGTGDTAVYVLARQSGEGSDREAIPGDILLTETEIRDIKALDQKYNRFLLALNVGGPVDLSPVKDVRNILLMSQLGTESGRAFADVLLGKDYPSGHLAQTWSAWEDYCKDGDFGNRDDTVYREGIYVGYRYFDHAGKQALFPFGFGLSYTKFSIQTGEIRSTETNGTVQLTISGSVTNTGNRIGRETVQVYLSYPESMKDVPVQVLAGWKKSKELESGEKEDFTVSFALNDFAKYDAEQKEWFLSKGEYILHVGNDSVHTENAGSYSLPDDLHFQRKASETDENADRAGIQKKLAGLSEEALARIIAGEFDPKASVASVIGTAASTVAGAGGESVSQKDFSGKDLEILKECGLPERPLVMADGPAGLRLAVSFYEDEKGAHIIGSSLPHSVLDIMPGAMRVFMKLMQKKPPKGAVAKHHLCTAIPIGTAIAQSWDTDFARACGDVVGDEMERYGVDLWLAPALNIQRDVRCGRNFEYYSEDPLISGEMAAGVTEGVQSHPGKGVTIKHFCANNQETNRYASNSVVAEDVLREIYLKGFEICIRKAHPAAVMTSYNLLNGTHTSEDRFLIQEILRGEWGYRGIVMTDWIVRQLSDKESKYGAPDAGAIAAAGGTLIMPGCPQDVKEIQAARSDGRLSREQLVENAADLLSAMQYFRKVEG